MKELEILGINLNQANIPPEMIVYRTVGIDSGGGGGVILTEGIVNNPDDQLPMKFLINEKLHFRDNQLPLQVKLLALTPATLKEFCTPIVMNLTSNEATETLVFPILSINTGEMIGQLYFSYRFTERNLVALSSPYGDPGEYPGHGGTADLNNYQLPPATTSSTQHLPMAYPGHHHGSGANFESESQPLLNRYPVQGYGPGFVPGYVGLLQPPVPGLQPDYPPLQQQASKMKRFGEAMGSVVKRVGAMAFVDILAEAAGSAVTDDGGDGLI